VGVSGSVQIHDFTHGSAVIYNWNWFVSLRWVKIVKRRSTHAPRSDVSLHLRASFENFRKINPDFVPVALAAFYAPDAVVVRIPEVVHRWTLDATSCENLVRGFLRDAAFDQRESMLLLRLASMSFSARASSDTSRPHT
jgi:hypothetical protein